MIGVVAALGRATIRQIRGLGAAALFLGVAAWRVVAPPWRPLRTLSEVDRIGAGSLRIILPTALFTGMVLALQGWFSLRRFGAERLLGSAVALGLVRELGPVLAALMVTARAGSAMTAEIGIMRNSDQIDALEVMALDPLDYLVSPRLLAILVALPLLVAIFDVVGMGGGQLVAVRLLALPSGDFSSSIGDAVEASDLLGGFAKAACFALLIGWVCTWKGYHCRPGAAGVARATTEAVVLSSVLVLVADYLLTSLLWG